MKLPALAWLCAFGSHTLSGYRPIEQQLVWHAALVRNVCLFSKWSEAQHHLKDNENVPAACWTTWKKTTRFTSKWARCLLITHLHDYELHSTNRGRKLCHRRSPTQSSFAFMQRQTIQAVLRGENPLLFRPKLKPECQPRWTRIKDLTEATPG